MLYITIFIKIMLLACRIKNYSFLSLTNSRMSRSEAWGCWYVSNVYLFFYWSMLILCHCHMFLLSYFIIFRHFIGLTYWQDAQCQFPVFDVFYFRKSISGNISELHQNLRRFFIPHDEAKYQRAAWGVKEHGCPHILVW